ncbi:carbonic anhydrase family protein [Helicobacter muridarum]|nr:carbonic anhydrase family protein [Helicobacter muridarum]TLE00233.1 carbonic anhydrase family protein [Helicobacter muridarum]
MFYCLLTSFCFAKDTDWSYEGRKLPQDKWQNNPLYLGCKLGNQQSPINISPRQAQQSEATKFTTQYVMAKGVNISIEQHSFQISYPRGSILEINNKKYQLELIRFKTPAENMINSNREIMEAQLFHKDSNGDILIMSIFFTEGLSSSMLTTLVRNLPNEPGKAYFLSNIDVNALLPKDLSSYQFDGSLTVPPCTQGVRWIVLKQTMPVTKSHVDAMRRITKSNARNAQEINDRLIIE